MIICVGPISDKVNLYTEDCLSRKLVITTVKFKELLSPLKTIIPVKGLYACT